MVRKKEKRTKEERDAKTKNPLCPLTHLMPSQSLFIPLVILTLNLEMKE